MIIISQSLNENPQTSLAKETKKNYGTYFKALSKFDRIFNADASGNLSDSEYEITCSFIGVVSCEDEEELKLDSYLISTLNLCSIAKKHIVISINHSYLWNDERLNSIIMNAMERNEDETNERI